MNLLLFAGNSQRNKTWIHTVGETLSPDFEKCVVHNYKHWDTGAESIDLDLELSRLNATVEKLDSYAVFAKSVGSILTLKAISQGIIDPNHCIFAGLPIKLAEEDGIPLQALIKNNSIPTMYIQNSNDPVASYSQLFSYLQEFSSKQYATTELPGDTHSYDDLDEMRSLITSFVYHVK